MLYVLLVGVSFAHNPRVAFACSGGPPATTLDTVLEEADYLVKGTVVQLDDANKNVIIRAEEYLHGGSGPYYLLLDRVSPVLSTVFYQYGYDTGCIYGGAGPLQLGLTAFWGLTRQDNGSYEVVDVFDMPLFQMPFPGLPYLQEIQSPTMNIRIDKDGTDDWENIERLEFEDESDFRNFVIDVTGEEPVLPEPGRLPRLRPLLLTFDDGSYQILPIDSNTPYTVELEKSWDTWSAHNYPGVLDEPRWCTEVGCIMSNSDHSLRAQLTAADEIEFNVPFGQLAAMPKTGRAFQFSSNGEAIAIWDGSQIEISLLQNLLCDCREFYGWHTGLTPMYSIEADDFSELATLRWSMDGTTIAYADSDGIWVLDLFRETEPTLVIEGDTLRPLSLFTSGRFVAGAREDGRWITVDRLTEESFDNALLSPDERRLVYIDDAANLPPLPDNTNCSQPIFQSCYDVFSLQALQSLTWVSSSIAVAVECDDGCVVSSIPVLPNNDPEGTYRQFSLRYPSVESDRVVVDMDFDDIYGVYALVLRDGLSSSELLLRSRNAQAEYGSSFTINNTIPIRSIVTDVRWLDSLFFTRSRS
jgi:hypothetical protein